MGGAHSDLARPLTSAAKTVRAAKHARWPRPRYPAAARGWCRLPNRRTGARARRLHGWNLARLDHSSGGRARVGECHHL